MRTLLLFTLLLFAATNGFSQQQNILKDENFTFDKPITKCEKKWVIFPKDVNAKNYPFGFIYIDPMAGFTFRLIGFFSIDQNKNYLLDSAAFGNKYAMRIFRINASAKPVAIITPDHYSQLHITAEPDWLKIYYKDRYEDTPDRNVKMGFIYNSAGDYEAALTFLNKVYQSQPHYAGLEFEMAYAHNALKQFDKAAMILDAAIKNDPGNAKFYSEIGYSYLGMSNLNKAIAYYQLALDHVSANDSNSKAEFAFNIGKAYNMMGNKEEFKNWMLKAKSFTPVNSPMYKAIIEMGF